MNFTQHRIASGIIAIISIWICWLSFTAEPAAAYLFPRIISIVLVLTALVTFAKAIMLRTKVGEGLSMDMFRNMLPGLVISGIYFFWAAKSLGFYLASTIAFLALLSIYDPAPHGKINTWIKRIIITAVFIVVIYALFAVVLNVYTPRGLFM